MTNKTLELKEDFSLSSYDFNLPNELIAIYPKPRGTSKLMVLQGENPPLHKQISDLADFLQAGDLLVFNDTKVIPARIKAQKPTGAKLEIMLERILPDNQLLVQIKGGKSLKIGQTLILPKNYTATYVKRHETMFVLQINSTQEVLQILQEIGEIPLPPYIARDVQASDLENYQTVFAKNHGAVAAPTAGLHFSQELLQSLMDKGIEIDFVTLHIGAGTFQPIRCENILEHKMHSEWLEVSQALCDKITEVKAKGAKVIAVGTTSVRSLETAAQNSKTQLTAFSGFSDIFIYPGYKWQVIDGILTNFHLPKSSLLLLVSAFKSKDLILQAYAEAIKSDYRFFSYGDASLLI